ncbi:MAG: hypothetical protein Rpha_1765 [Candidatus Ruthia sp. Apha_13_S6]|nr:hypothetical protein [Candidatus Ruthia sp. Apha_13_S6]
MGDKVITVNCMSGVCNIAILVITIICCTTTIYATVKPANCIDPISIIIIVKVGIQRCIEVTNTG